MTFVHQASLIAGLAGNRDGVHSLQNALVGRGLAAQDGRLRRLTKGLA
jgi:hypothetical protein